MRKIFDEKYHFRVDFDTRSGYYLRTGILSEKGKDTGAEPFMASFPHLLDIGIMGHCAHGLSGRCLSSTVECYQEGNSIKSEHMTLLNYKKIVDQAKGRCFQFALGGRGDPELHPDFEAILDYTRTFNIVPNFTTSGYGLTKEHALITKKYCGAVAVSWYRQDHTLQSIHTLLEAGNKVNIHYVLGNHTIDEFIYLLENNKFPDGINRIILLLHKPVGLGQQKNVLKVSDPKVKYLFELFNDKKYCDHLGFDSCCVPAVLNFSKKIAKESYDACEAGRFSAYIDADMMMTTCSFDRKKEYGESLRDYSIEEVWNSERFIKFRQQLTVQCPQCDKKEFCFGGCPITPEIVLCAEKAW